MITEKMKEEYKKDIDELYQFYEKQNFADASILKELNMDDFQAIVNLYEEKQPMSDEKWNEYIQLAKDSEDIQMAIAFHPDVPYNVINELIEKTHIDPHVCARLAHTSKDFPEETVNRILKNIVFSDLPSSLIGKNVNVNCANVMAKNNISVYASITNNEEPAKLDKCTGDALWRIDDDNIAKQLLQHENLVRHVLLDIGNNTRLSDEIREEAINRVTKDKVFNSVVYMVDFPKPMINEWYENAIDKVFKYPQDEQSMYATIKLHDFIMQRKLNEGQLRNLWNLCKTEGTNNDEIAMDVFYRTESKDIIREYVDMSREKYGSIPIGICEGLCCYEHFPKDLKEEALATILSQYTTKPDLTVLPYEEGEDWLNSKNATLGELEGEICNGNKFYITKEIEDILFKLDKQSLYKFYSSDRGSLKDFICALLMYHDVSKELINRFEQSPHSVVRLCARFANEFKQNKEFADFCRNTTLINASKSEITKFKENLERVYTDNSQERANVLHDFCTNLTAYPNRWSVCTKDDINFQRRICGFEEPTENDLYILAKQILCDESSNTYKQHEKYLGIAKALPRLKEIHAQIEKLEEEKKEKCRNEENEVEDQR